jgi:hypothetical protein
MGCVGKGPRDVRHCSRILVVQDHMPQATVGSRCASPALEQRAGVSWLMYMRPCAGEMLLMGVAGCGDVQMRSVPR